MNVHTIENELIRLTLLSLGATIYKVEIKPLANRNIVLSTKDLANYYTPENGYFGATIGRVAGRIGNGVFKLDDKRFYIGKNEKVSNSLHGGFASFAFKEFNVIKKTNNEITFAYLSADGEGGYPGEVNLLVTYSLQECGFHIKYHATTTKKTLLNITNHSYFNLDGSCSVLDHMLKADALAMYTHDTKQLNDKHIPITIHDPLYMNNGKKLEYIILDKNINTSPAFGLDHTLEINGPLTLEGKDLIMEVRSNYPAVQLYSTNFPTKFVLVNDKRVKEYHALAIEPVDIVQATAETYPHLEIAPNKTYEREIAYNFILK